MAETLKNSATTLGSREGDNVLVALAHPDDEVLFGGAITALRKKRAIVHVAVATDGEASTRGDTTLVQSGGRRKEANSALADYSIPVRRRHFLALPDGGLNKGKFPGQIVPAPALVAELGWLATSRDIRSIVTFDRNGYDGHDDHAALFAAAQQVQAERSAASKPLRLFGLTKGPNELYIPVDPAAKLRALAHHASQFTVHFDPSIPSATLGGIRLSVESAQHLQGYWMTLALYEGYIEHEHQALPVQSETVATEVGYNTAYETV